MRREIHGFRVREFRTDDHRDYAVVLQGGEKLRLSRTFREEVERRLGDRI
jgi:DNA-binding LytR/AlgR family response regulator